MTGQPAAPELSANAGAPAEGGDIEASHSTAEGSGTPAPRPRVNNASLYVTPYYSSQGPVVAVGPWSDRLRDVDLSTIDALVADISAERDALRPEVLYVLSIRLYDLGLKDDAYYWYMTAATRARTFARILDEESAGIVFGPGFELRSAYGAFHQLAGMCIGGYAFGDLNMVTSTLERIISENQSPLDYAALFPDVPLLPADQWPAKLDEVNAGMAELIAYCRDHAEEIRAQRAESGIDGMF